MVIAALHKAAALSLAKMARAVRPSHAGTLSGRRTVVTAQPQRLALADQWARLAGVLNGAISNATEARQLQSAATQQLDLAQYALSTLMDELSAVMAVPGRRERASVHVLETGPQRAASRALAA